MRVCAGSRTTSCGTARRGTTRRACRATPRARRPPRPSFKNSSFTMQTRGSTGSGLGEREEELRRRNEDVDRRRADALRIASDVVRHQEVSALRRVLARARLRRWPGALGRLGRAPRPRRGVTADGAPACCACGNVLTVCLCRPRPPAPCARQEKLVHSPGSARASSARSERASADSSPAKSTTSSHSRPQSAHSRCVRVRHRTLGADQPRPNDR